MVTRQRINELIASFAEGPGLLESAVADISGEERHFKPGPEHWSIHENVVHVADCDLVFAERIRRVLAEPGGLLTAIDDQQWARVLNYPALSLEGSLALLRSLRATTTELLRHAPAEVWEQTGTHSEKGPQTLEWIVGYAADHVHYHLRTIAKRRRQYAEARQTTVATEGTRRGHPA